MTSIARLRDLLLDEEPQMILGCTYGFESEFFEQEILPAALPSLALDRGTGNTAAYLHAGDEALRRCPTLVVCDHHESGKELGYGLARYRGNTAFHPKLLVLDYPERIRVIVSSANLTRSGWTSALELFVFEDMEPGKHHSWAEPLISFIEGVRANFPSETAELFDPFLGRLREVKSKKPGKGEPRLLSSLEGPLLDRMIEGAPPASKADVVTPFLEGEGGSGVFDRLDSTYPGIQGTLYVRAEGPDSAPIIRGPEEKLRTLFSSGRWSVRRVRREWEGDAEDCPPRQLHGKLLALRDGNRTTAMVGSANVTSAGLLGSPPRGNVELCVLLDLKSRELKAILPQSEKVELDTIQIEPPEAEPEPTESVVDFVIEAIYYAATGKLELTLKKGAPTLTVAYQGKELTDSAKPPVWSQSFRLGRELEVTINAGGDQGIVPFLILEPELLEPRGRAGKPGLNELLEIMAGTREAIDEGEGQDGPGNRGTPPRPGDDLLQDGGAFAWRKLMRGLSGLQRDLVANAAIEVEVRRLLDGPLGARALLDALDSLRGSPEFLDADYAFTIHQLRTTISAARGEIRKANRPLSAGAGADLDRWIDELSSEFSRLRRSAKGDLRAQFDVLQAED